MIKSIRLLGALLVFALSTGLVAQPGNPAPNPAPAPENAPVLTAELNQFLVVIDKGKEVLKPVDQAKPGDLIEYQVVYTNRTQSPLSEVVAELPIPIGLEYQPKTTRPAATALAAVQGGRFAREPLMRPGANGQLEPVPYSEYRQLRWTLGQIAAGSKAQVSARVRVTSGVPNSSTTGR